MPRPTGSKKSDALHIRIDESVKKSIQEKVASGEYEDITDFIRKAIKNELNRESDEEKIERIVGKIVDDRLREGISDKLKVKK